MLALLLGVGLLGGSLLLGAAWLGFQAVMDHYFPPNPDLAACDKGDAEACARMAQASAASAAQQRAEAEREEQAGHPEVAAGYRRNADDEDRRAGEYRERARTGRR